MVYEKDVDPFTFEDDPEEEEEVDETEKTEETEVKTDEEGDDLIE